MKKIEYHYKQNHCFDCEFRKGELFCSGIHPIYKYWCFHPKTVAEWSIRKSRFIGDEDIVPEWCPILKGEKE